jgi:UDP:flavonoid glycosyltransferase YjiC (YdhE family)
VKILFLPGASAATVFALAPLATAARNAGHQVFMATTEEMAPYVTGTGIPPVCVSALTPPQYMFADRDGSPVAPPQDPEQEESFAGRGFARYAAASIDALERLGRDWRPDLVVGGSLAYAAGLLAARLRVPWVRHFWDPSETGESDRSAADELRPELRAVGLEGLPEPDLYVDICPPSLRAPTAPDARMLRWVPGNQQRPLDSWMYTRPAGKRVCVTSGSRAADGPVRDRDFAFLRDLAGSLAPLDVEVVIAAPEGLAGDLRPALGDGVRAGWVPLDVLAPTCDLVVHHGGGVTSMTAMNAGVPQLVIPQLTHSVAPARRLAAYGAGRVVLPGEVTADGLGSACEELLSTESYGKAARELAGEIAALPRAAEVVDDLERLTRAG